MTTKYKDRLPESVRAHIPTLDGLLSDDDVVSLLKPLDIELKPDVTPTEIAQGFKDVIKARLVRAMHDLKPHPRSYYDRLQRANNDIQNVISALSPGDGWNGWSDWPRSHLAPEDSFDGCQDNYDPLNAALSAAQWLKQRTRVAMDELKRGGLLGQGRKLLRSRNIYLAGIARVYESSFGIPYTRKVGCWHPYFKVVLGIDELLLNHLREYGPEYIPYAEYSSIKNMDFDDMHNALRSDETLKTGI